MNNYGTLVGNSAAMRQVYSLIEKAALVDMPVFILGETGTGKELVARAIHDRSNRCDQPFVAINMGAVPSELIASELFGHEKGSFTGANDNRVGRFEEAQDGTLFLDEVTTMDEQVQVALLRVLESQKYRRVGGKSDFTTNARILAASNQDPTITSSEHHHFRQDLLHRLQVIRITIPPLRKRQKDIADLVHYFMHEISSHYGHVSKTIQEEALEVLRQYSWPGNVRELRNVIYQAAILAGEQDITPHHLPQHILDAIQQEAIQEANPAIYMQPTVSPVSNQNGRLAQTPFLNSLMNEGVYFPVGLSMEEVEKAYITKTLALTGNNKTRAARMLGISRKALYSKLNKWDLLEKNVSPTHPPDTPD